VCVDAVSRFGLVGDGATDNTATFNNMIADLNSTGQEYCIRPGTYDYVGSSLNNITSTGGSIRGLGNIAVIMQDTATAGDSWKIGNGTTTSAFNFSMKNLRFRPKNLKTTGSEITCAGGSYDIQLSNLWFEYVATAVSALFCTNLQIDNVILRYIYSQFGIYAVGLDATHQVNAVNIRNMNGDNPWAIAPSVAGSKTRVNTTAYNAGDYYTVNGYLWQVVVAGTTGTSTAAYVLPNANALSPTTANVTDGSVQARFMSNSALTWIYQGSFARSLKVTDSELIDGVHCVSMDDVVNSGTSFPIWFFYDKMDCDHQYSDAILLVAGRGFRGTTGFFGSSLDGNGISENTNFLGEVSIAGGEIIGNAMHGYVMNNPTGHYTMITNVLVGFNGQLAFNAFNGVSIVTNRADYIITNNSFGPNNGGTADSQHCAVLTNGTTDQVFNVSFNIARGQANGTTSASAFCFGATQSVSARINNLAH
jgi:hypothetical protein